MKTLDEKRRTLRSQIQSLLFDAAFPMREIDSILALIDARLSEPALVHTHMMGYEKSLAI